MALQIRRGTDAERTAGGGVIFAEGELIYVTDTDALYVGDGSTAGGILLSSTAFSTIGSYLVADTINSTLDLQQDLDLNGNDIIGTGNININGTITATGNINIGDDANTDTVDFTAKITSTLTPSADSTYDIGSATARWNNGYFTGLVVDGQLDAVAVNADVVADNSTVMVDVSANTFAGNLTGDVTGVIRDTVGGAVLVPGSGGNASYIGSVTGDVTGDAAGNHTGTFNGTVGDVTPDAITGTLITANTNFAGDITGNVTGDVVGNIKGSISNDPVVNTLQGPADAVINAFDITATGTITGNLSGNVSGNVTGNAAGDHTGTFTGAITATGTLDGDVTGSVFADNSTVLVDAVAGTIPSSVISGTITNDVNATNVTGNLFTNLIDSTDSSAINVVPATNFNAAVNFDQDIRIGGINGVFIDDNTIDAYSATVPTALSINSISADPADETTDLFINSNTTFAYDATVAGKFTAFGDRAISAQYRTQLSETNTGFFVVEYSGDPVDSGELQDINNYAVKTKITETVADFATAVKFANIDSTARDALAAEAGMVIFNTTTTKLQVCTAPGTGGAATWVDLH